MVSSMSPILHSCTFCTPINQARMMSLRKIFLFSLILHNPCNPQIEFHRGRAMITMILAHGVCVKEPHALRGPQGRAGGEPSAVHSRRVTAEWPNCLPLLSQ